MKWSNFIKEVSNLIFFWFFGILFFLIFRLSFIWFFREQIQETDFKDFLLVLWTGFRFDCMATSYFLIVPLLALLILAPFNKFTIIRTIRKTFQILFAILSPLISIIAINYFIEYNQQFNHFIFLALYDDQKAVMHTLLKDFHPILNGSILLILIVLCIWIFQYFEKRNCIASKLEKINFKGSKYVIATLIPILFLGSIRGSFTSNPIRKLYSAVSKDFFLNKSTLNPYNALKYAFQDFKRVNNYTQNPFLNNQEFAEIYPYSKVTDILKKEAKGALIEKPKQVFLIVMESYDSWPLMDKYQPLGLTKNLRAIADEGTRFTSFLPAAYSTFNSFGAITSGVPYCGINIGDVGDKNEPYASSIFNQFKKLGYKSNFFYGGFLTWEDIGDYCKYQGADKMYSGADTEEGLVTGTWGVDDETLFNLALDKIDPNSYSLNVILTVSYHPPYTVDIYKKGFPYKSSADFPKDMQHYCNGSNGMPINVLGHLWYSDKAIGDFMKVAKEKYPNAIFCFTGDHFSRRHVTNTPNQYERSSVNFIMYGKNIPAIVKETPGTHIDITPTLIEMIAPKGFEYYSFGQSLFNSDKEQGISFENMVRNNEMDYLPRDNKKHKITLDSMKETEIENADEYMREYNKLMGLAWHYTIKGNDIKK